MTRFQIGIRSLELEAHLVLPAAASNAASWAGGRWVTVKLSAPLEALRVHTDGRAFLAQGRPASTEAGRWLLIDDVIQTAAAIASSRSLKVDDPRSAVAFTHTSGVELALGTVLNIGFASALFSGRGGGAQAERVGGPPPRFTLLAGKHWHSRAGRA